jgi:hypothetical protein
MNEVLSDSRKQKRCHNIQQQKVIHEIFHFYFLAVLGFELRALQLLDWCPTT